MTEVKDPNRCPQCGAVPDAEGNVTHSNPTNEQRARASREGVPVGVVQERDLFDLALRRL